MTRKMRTLLFSSLYPSSVRPGYGIFVEARLRELLASGAVETKVVSPVPWFFSTHPCFGDYARMASIPRREIHNGVDVLHPRYFIPPMVGMNIAPFMMALGAEPTVRKLLDDGFNFDLIDAHYYYPDGVAAALLAQRFGKPFTVTARGSDINLIATHSFPRRLMRWASRHATASIGVSSALTHAMEEIGVAKSSLLTMPNGVNLTHFDLKDQTLVRSELGWPDLRTLLSVGNLVTNKGHHIAIEALIGLPDYRLVIAGEGPERRNLESLALQVGVSSRVEFLGQVDQGTLAQCYCAADILLLLSSREGWPNVLLESMACGTPVIASAVGGIPEIVTSDNVGRLVRARTAQELILAVGDLWASKPERNTVRAHAEACSWSSTTQAQLTLFRRIFTEGRDTAHA